MCSNLAVPSKFPVSKYPFLQKPLDLSVLARAAIILLRLIMWFLAQQSVLIPNQCSKGDHFPFPVLFNTLFLTVLACEARAACGTRGSGGVTTLPLGASRGDPP